MRKGGPFVVSLRFNPLESISINSVAVAKRQQFCSGSGSWVWTRTGLRRGLEMMSRVCRGESWQGDRQGERE